MVYYRPVFSLVECQELVQNIVHNISKIFQVRGYKVKLNRTGEQIGIALSGGLSELIQKAKEKLNLQPGTKNIIMF